jgi:hypothetical protein
MVWVKKIGDGLTRVFFVGATVRSRSTLGAFVV